MTTKKKPEPPAYEPPYISYDTFRAEAAKQSEPEPSAPTESADTPQEN